MAMEFKNAIKPEQYELEENSRHPFKMNRRKFFGALGSGIAVVITLNQVLGASAFAQEREVDDSMVAAWLHINEDGRVTVFTGKVEVGQNIRTSLAQAVAEELRFPFESVVMTMGDTSLTPFDMGTFGSRTTPTMAPILRKAAATVRELLLDMAADQWKVDRKSLTIQDGEILSTRPGKRQAIGEILKGKDLIKKVNDNIALTPAPDWKVAGHSIPKVDGIDFVTGRHQYVSDLREEGMLFGKVLRAPAYGSSLTSVDLSGAQSIPGVVAVHDGDFVGVAASDLVTANEALSKIKAEWSRTPQPSRSAIFDYLRKNSSGGGRGDIDEGNVDHILSSASRKIEKTFYVDYIAHAPLEPRAAFAKWEADQLSVWTGTQRPFGVQEELSNAFNMPKNRVRVIMPDTGSGYGGKHTGEAAIEAARLARAAGKPVSLVWTREEEFTWAYFRPAGVIDVKGAIDDDGILTAWEFHNYNSGGSGIDTPYSVQNQRIHFHPVDSPLRQGSYRGLASTANHFARESIMNDLAEIAGMDPYDFRMKNLKEERIANVLKAVADKFNWSARTPERGRGFGLAVGNEKGSFVACCAEVNVSPAGDVKIVRVTEAFECGAIVNPEHLKNQVQGAIIQGLGGALFEYIDFKDGKILNPHFSSYRVPRFSDIPDQMDIVLLDRKDIPSAGAGETPIMVIAPAIRNAIADATGQKLYTLPMLQKGLK